MTRIGSSAAGPSQEPEVQAEEEAAQPEGTGEEEAAASAELEGSAVHGLSAEEVERMTRLLEELHLERIRHGTPPSGVAET
mmetsp:Transcript_13757/g.40388  ORF Transcript_13757/g.40388 Transcript_13757/m.40388 type:complete len:81 (+) Transcript_13757:3-245(+)